MKSFFIVSLVLSLQKGFCLSSLTSNVNSVNWTCFTDISCINVIVNEIKSGKSVNIGYLTIEADQNSPNEARGIEKSIPSFLKTRSLNISLGKFLVNISASQKHDKYIEISLSRGDAEEGRGDRRRMQMFVPAFMVASQVGWYMLALKLVTTLAIKALLVSKMAFFVAAIITIKKLILEPMHVSPPITPFYDNVDPYTVPYDFSTFGHHDLHPLSIAHLGHAESPIVSASALHQSNPVAAESSVNSVTESRSGLHNTSATTAAASPKIKKEIKRFDYISERRPLYFYQFKNPFLNFKR